MSIVKYVISKAMDDRYKKGLKKAHLQEFIAGFMEEEMRQNGFEVWVNGAWYRIRNGVISYFGADKHGIHLGVQPIYSDFHYLGECGYGAGMTPDTPHEVYWELYLALTDYLMYSGTGKQTEMEQQLQQLLTAYWCDYAKPLFDKCTDVDSMSYALDDSVKNKYQRIQECSEDTDEMIQMKAIPLEILRMRSVRYRSLGESGFLIECARLNRYEEGIACLNSLIDQTEPIDLPERIERYRKHIEILEQRNVEYLNEEARRIILRNLEVIRKGWPRDKQHLLPDAEELVDALRL